VSLSASSEPVREPTTIDHATEQYLSDDRSRNLRESTIYKYDLLFRNLKRFARENGLRFVKELNLEILRGFREDWRDGPRSHLKNLERLRTGSTSVSRANG